MIRKKNDNPEKAAGLFVLSVFLITILDNLIRPEFVGRGVAEMMYHISRPSYLLVGPALLVYVRALLREKGFFTYTVFLHFLPYGIWLVYAYVYPSSLHPDSIFAGNSTVLIQSPPRRMPLFNLHWDVWKNISLLIYVIIVLYLIYRHRKRVPDFYSSLDTYTTLSWFRNLLFLYAGISLFNVIVDRLIPEASEVFQVSMAVGRVLPPVLFVFFFSLFSGAPQVWIPEPELLETGETEETQADENRQRPKRAKGEGKYEKSGLAEEESHALFNQLRMYISREKPFLEPDLTLEELAAALGETRHRLSETINREAGVKFYRFINTYRLEEFKEAVQKNRYPDYTILAVALECGFRSQSAFYNLFKEVEGMTPRAYMLLH
ncbi:MAG: helix-turn-helix transcriptional regulator [Sphaerochaetaceae bacterium]|nr:helix-turn-helix transcriptional regulator [Sphaerochaetaceae bacterium]